jgi:hypothetical protein
MFFLQRLPPVDGTTIDNSTGQLALASAYQKEMRYVGSFSVSGSASTSLSVTGLDLDTDERYVLFVSLEEASTNNNMVSLTYNSDTTATNYYSQNMLVSHNSLSGDRSNTARILYLYASTATNSRIEIWNDNNSNPRAMALSNLNTMATVSNEQRFHVWNTAGTNVTGLTLTGDQANGLAVGSKIEVFKVVG